MAVYQSKQIWSLVTNPCNEPLNKVALHRYDRLSNTNEDIVSNLASGGAYPLWFGANVEINGRDIEPSKVIDISDIDLDGKVQKQYYYNETKEESRETIGFLIDWQSKNDVEEPVIPNFLLVQKNGEKYKVLSGAKHVFLCVNSRLNVKKIMVTEMFPAQCGKISFPSEKPQFDNYREKDIYSLFDSLYKRMQNLSLLNENGKRVKKKDSRIKGYQYEMLNSFMSFYRTVVKYKELMNGSAVEAYYPYIANIENILNKIEQKR